MKYQDGQWYLVQKNELLNKVVDRKFSIMNNFLDDHVHIIDENTVNRYEKFQEKLDNDENRENIVKDCYITILNNRDIVDKSIKLEDGLKNQNQLLDVTEE